MWSVEQRKPERIIEGRALLLGGLRRVHSFRGSIKGVPAQWEKFREMGPIPGQQGTTMYGVMWDANPDTRKLEYLAGVEVAALEALPRKCGWISIPAQRYAVFLHQGPWSTLYRTWASVWHEWLPLAGYQSRFTPEIEIYDERFDPRTASGVVEIWAAIERGQSPGPCFTQNQQSQQAAGPGLNQSDQYPGNQ
jgi:AraC family transcriptional regulator